MLLKNVRCRICKSERAVRPCPRLGNKAIGWNCCNETRAHLNCPQACAYAPKTNNQDSSPFPAFRADSNTEYQQVLKRVIDLWIKLPLPELDHKSPFDLAREDSFAVLGWLEKYQYPANFPVDYLMEKLGITHTPQPVTITPETIATEFMDNVVTLQWEALEPLTSNDRKYPPCEGIYRGLLSSIPMLQKTRDYAILHAGAADDGVSALVMLEINHKHDWTMILTQRQGSWRVRQNLNGSPRLYYKQNELFHELAAALGQGQDQKVDELLNQNLPLYPDCADLRYYKALSHQLRKQYEPAKNEYLNAIALDNYYQEAIFALSVLQMNDRQFEAARYWLEVVTALIPDDLNVKNNLAACHAALGETERALAIWKELQETAPTYEPALKNLERYKS